MLHIDSHSTFTGYRNYEWRGYFFSYESMHSASQRFGMALASPGFLGVVFVCALRAWKPLAVISSLSRQAATATVKDLDTEWN
jgi:hypothetical protein